MNPFLAPIWSGLAGRPGALANLKETGEGALPSVFAVTDLASAAVGAAGLAATELLPDARREVLVDRRLASMWFVASCRPIGWSPPPPWDPIAGDYPTADGWIRLHTNAPHHRAAALKVLQAPPERAAVAQFVAGWRAEALETAIVEANGCAAEMRSVAEWVSHRQGAAVAAEPLVHVEQGTRAGRDWRGDGDRPLAGLRVLDLTRVLAGPVATRFLAGLGAEVLRIDPPDWDEPGVLPDVTLGKRCARLDLRAGEGREIFEKLLADADVLVHGYRSDALERLGFGSEARQALSPGLVDVSLDAYGWSGPWKGRRGFDSLVQMSSGIAAAGMKRLGKEKPFPLPAQALDHACGYLMAASALIGLARRRDSGAGSIARLSLARVAALLVSGPEGDPGASIAPPISANYSAEIEQTGWGPAQRLISPVTIGGAPLSWKYAAGPLGAARAVWEG